jgi:tetratricopeptide (TPR) repeat protein
VRSQLGLGALFKELHRYQEAETQLQAASTSFEPLVSSTALTDRQLQAELAYQRGVLWARVSEARGALATGNSGTASVIEQAYGDALRFQEEMVKAHPYRADLRAKLGRYRNNLGKLLYATGRPDAAEKELRASLAIIPNPPILPGERWQSARAMHNLGVLLAKPGLRAKQGSGAEEVLKLLRAAKGQLEMLTKEFPDVPQYRQELATICLHLGQQEDRNRQPAPALEHLERALELLKKLVADFPDFPDHRMDLAAAANWVAFFHLSSSNPPQAETISREAVLALSKLADHQPPVPSYLFAVGCAHHDMAVLFERKLKKRNDARVAIEQSIRYLREALDLSPENQEYRAKLDAVTKDSSMLDHASEHRG